jgi:type II secretory pathway pseudopilin PulG
MASVRVYLVGLVVLAVVAAVFAVLWFMAYTNYANLEVEYANLQNQYNALQSQYQQLQTQFGRLNSTYWSLLESLGYASGGGTLLPGYYKSLVILVPSGYVGSVHITVSSTPSNVEVYVFDLHNYAMWYASGSYYSYYLYDAGTYINDQVSLNPGVYVVVIDNPNITSTTISFTITTTYTSPNG